MFQDTDKAGGDHAVEASSAQPLETRSTLKDGMAKVERLAKDLALSQSDKFTVSLAKDGEGVRLTARTSFDTKVEGEGKILSTLTLHMTIGESGVKSEEINIMPKKGTWMDDGAFSYRLDIKTDAFSEGLFDRAQNAETGTAENKFLEFFDTSDGEHRMYMDRFAETTVTAKGAAMILEGAENLHRPDGFYGISSGISLKEFRDWLEEQQRKGNNNIAGLLKASL